MHVFGAWRSALTSMGSTSCAMTTSCAFFCSTSDVTWLMPYLTTGGGFLLNEEPSPSALFAASCFNLSFFCSLVSGLYLFNRRKSWVAGQRGQREEECKQDWLEKSVNFHKGWLALMRSTLITLQYYHTHSVLGSH